MNMHVQHICIYICMRIVIHIRTDIHICIRICLRIGIYIRIRISRFSRIRSLGDGISQQQQ